MGDVSVIYPFSPCLQNTLFIASGIFFLKGDFNFSLNVIIIPLPRFDMFSSFTVATKQTYFIAVRPPL